MKKLFFYLIVFTTIFLPAKAVFAQAESLGKIRSRGLEILDEVKKMVEEKYYDPKFRGIDLEKNYKTAREEIKKSERNGHVYAIIAQFLLDFNDSHLFFLPPDRVQSVDYGFRMKMVGDNCYISAVRKGSDAEKQGVKVGDTVYSLETFEPTRESLWKLQYFYYRLSPQPVIRLVIQNPDKTLRQANVQATIKTPKEREKEFKERQKKEKEREKNKDDKKDTNSAYKCKEADTGLMVCNLKTFSTPEKNIDKMMSEVGQRKSLILDLRDNGGGYVKTMKHLIGYFFDKDVKIGTEKTRKATREEIAKTQGDKVFRGNLTVLIDSNSGSASEVFSRVIQLEKRGTIIGDRSAGAVMKSIKGVNAYVRGVDILRITPYGISVTISDLIMTDGKSLESVGVQPDVIVLPRSEDLFKKRDVVLSRAAELLGFTLDAETAGKFFLKEEETNIEEEESEDNDG